MLTGTNIEAGDRRVTLAVLAHAFLVAAAVTSTPASRPSGSPDLQQGQAPVRHPGCLARDGCCPRLRWSAWRRRQQARARTYHYRRQAAWDR
jgi:hypothetical protein